MALPTTTPEPLPNITMPLPGKFTIRRPRTTLSPPAITRPSPDVRADPSRVTDWDEASMMTGSVLVGNGPSANDNDIVPEMLNSMVLAPAIALDS